MNTQLMRTWQGIGYPESSQLSTNVERWPFTHATAKFGRGVKTHVIAESLANLHYSKNFQRERAAHLPVIGEFFDFSSNELTRKDLRNADPRSN
jgi:hypothetical protein